MSGSPYSGARRRRVHHRLAAVLLMLMLMLTVAYPSTAGAASDGNALPRTYEGATYGPGLQIGPTQFEQQSKMWFHDDAWWALMLEPSSTMLRVFELLPDHSWRPTRAVIDVAPNDTGDVLTSGDTAYVVYRRADSTVQFTRLHYDPGSREYDVDQAPTLVTDRGSAAPASIVKDSTGRLWVAFATATDIIVTYSDSDGSSWLSRPDQQLIPIPGNGPDRRPAGSLVAFDRSVGFLWTEQRADTIRFGIHRDGAPPTEWAVETALTGPGFAGDELSVKVVPGDPSSTIVAAVRTLNGAKPEDPGDAPLVNVLVRAPDGTWSSQVAATVSDAYHSSIVQVDATNRMLYLLAGTGGDVRYKRTPINDLSFVSGPGSVFVQGKGRRLTDLTGSKQTVSPRTGLVTLASSTTDRFYQHAELALPGTAEPPDLPDTTPPSAPAELIAGSGDSGNVSISWSSSNDGVRWSAAADTSPVGRYIVSRDGVEIGDTSATSYGDVPPVTGQTYEYQVRAVDASGNRSEPSSATVSVAQSGKSSAIIIGAVLLGAAVLGGGALAIRRVRLDRSIRL